MRKAFYVWRLNPIAETFCSNPFEFLSRKIGRGKFFENSQITVRLLDLDFFENGK